MTRRSTKVKTKIKAPSHVEEMIDLCNKITADVLNEELDATRARTSISGLKVGSHLIRTQLMSQQERYRVHEVRYTRTKPVQGDK